MPVKPLLIKRVLVIALASVVILAGLLVGGVRLIDHLMPGYRQALADRIGERLGADVGIDAIELSWQWRGPVLELSNVSLQRHGADKPAVTMDRLGLHFAFSDLLHGKRQPDGIQITAPRLALRLGDDNRPKLVHWSRAGDPPLGWDTIRGVRRMLRKVRIDDARIQLQSSMLPGGQGTLDPVSIQWRDEAGQLTWQASAEGPDWFKHIEGSGDFVGTLPRVDNAHLSIDVDAVDTLALAKAGDRLDPALATRLSGGALSTNVVATFANSRLQSARTQIDLAAIDDSAHDKSMLPALAAIIDAAGLGADSVRADGNDLSFVVSRLTGDIPKLADFSLTGAVDTDTPTVRIDARHPPMTVVLRLARLFYPRLAETDINAAIDHVAFAAGVDRPTQLGFDFTDFSIADPRLSLGPVAGRYDQHGSDHRLTFSDAGGTLVVDRYLRGELPIDDLDGVLAWRPGNNGWDINAHQLTLKSGTASVDVDGKVHLPAEGAPVVDITAKAAAPEAARLLAHIPQAPDLPNERLRDWLPKAIKSGHLESAQLELAGPLDRFPFDQPRAGERFLLNLRGNGVDVAYKPDWPPLENARGTLTLDGDDLRVDVASARMLGVALSTSRGHVPDVREPILQIDGTATGQPADKMLAFLSKSPLRKKFAKLVEAISITGPADLALDLSIPLKPSLGEPAFKGTVSARGNTLRQKVLPGPITDITGNVEFDDRGLSARNLQGNLLGVAISTNLTPRPDNRQRIVTDAKLALPRDKELVAHYLPASWLTYGHGSAATHVAFEIARDGQVSDIALDSNLVGMGLDLPAPLTKTAASAAPLKVNIAGDASRVDIDYDQRLNVGVRLREGQPTRLQARFNDPNLQAPDVDGIWIGGHTATLDGIGWFHVVREQLAAAEKAQSSGDDSDALVFYGGNLSVAELDLDNRYFQDAQLRAQPMSARPGWRIDFEGPNTQGQVTWTQPDGGAVNIAGNLARLALKTRPPQKTPQVIDKSPVIWKDVSPRDLPRLDVDVARLHVDDTDFGHASVQAHALFNGWQLDRFQLADGALVGWANGHWTRDDGTTQASAQTRLDGRGLAGLLRTLGYAPTVRAKAARVEARLTIAPNPNGLDLRKLNGEVGLTLDDGTLVSVEPGAARVLGLVNLYVLPRRLRMDFRDVVDEGLAFDSVRANFDIRDGDAHSDNVRINTPSSKIRMSGRIGLAARDYDERVTIAPKVGSSVAIASGVLGGPLVGAAVFAFQELFKKPIQKFSSIAYTLKGSWDDPTIAEPSTEE